METNIMMNMTHAGTWAGPGIANHPLQAMQLYRRQQVLTGSSLQRLLLVYDVALQACANQDLEKFSRGVGVLRDSLDLSQGQVAASLLSLYIYCDDLARRGRWGEAAHILRELRDAWETAGRET